MLEVPLSSSSSNDELLDSQDERDGPEEAEEEDPEHDLRISAILDNGKHVAFDEFWIAGAVQEYIYDNVAGQDRQAHDIAENWHDDNSGVGADEVSCGTHDFSTNLDISALAAEEADVEEGEDSSDDGTGHSIFSIIRTLWELLHLEVAPCGDKTTENEDQEQGCEKDWLGDPSEEAQIEKCNDERSKAHHQDDLPALDEICHVFTEAAELLVQFFVKHLLHL